MTTSTVSKPSSAPASAWRGPGSNPSEDCQDTSEINWTVIVPVTLISAVVLLLGLPLGAVLIMSYSGCCLTNGTEHVVTFWASMIAGFLALFGMVVTGVFVITAFRVDATARAKAQLSAREEVWTYIERYRDKLFEELRDLRELAPRVKQTGEETMQTMAKAQEDVEAHQREAIRAITHAQSETASAADEAQRAISEVRDETTDVARQAQGAIGGALEETTNAAGEAQRAIGEVQDQTIGAANEAQEAIVGVRQEVEGERDEAIGTIDSARQEVERQRDEAIGTIDSARREVETAARAARDRIGGAGDRPQGEGASD